MTKILPRSNRCSAIVTNVPNCSVTFAPGDYSNVDTNKGSRVCINGCWNFALLEEVGTGRITAVDVLLQTLVNVHHQDLCSQPLLQLCNDIVLSLRITGIRTGYLILIRKKNLTMGSEHLRAVRRVQFLISQFKLLKCISVIFMINIFN